MTTRQVHIATSRPIGAKCLAWAEANMPDGWALSNTPQTCDVFISVMYGSLVSEEFINRPGRRCYNFHPGILPQYRGSGAFSWAILNGEKECGITLHELDVNIDTGPIIDMATFPVYPDATAKDLFDRGMTRLFELFKKWLPTLLTGTYAAFPQEERLAHTYYRKDLGKQADLTRFVRAFTFEGKEPAFYYDRNGNKVEVRW